MSKAAKFNKSKVDIIKKKKYRSGSKTYSKTVYNLETSLPKLLESSKNT